MRKDYTKGFNKGKQKICQYIKQMGSVCDIDIVKATGLTKSTVLIYRSQLVQAGIIERHLSTIRAGRTRPAWQMKANIPRLVVAAKTVAAKVKTQPKSEIQTSIKLLHQILNLIEKEILKL
jgi:predicted ArsR family transcriptional regulator